MRRTVPLILICITVACAPKTRTIMLGTDRTPDTDPSDILVYSSKVPECPFEEIALVTAVQGAFDYRGGLEAALDALKQKAHALGGHAIVGLEDRPKTKAEGPSLSGTVVRFTSDDCRPTPAGAPSRR